MPMKMQAQWRERRAAIGRKGFDAELLHDSEVMCPLKQPAQAPMSSPISILGLLEAEIQPISLPDAWTVVGKNGKPLKNAKMYDPPPERAQKKTKKKRMRKPQGETEDDTLLAALAELPSSSVCHEKLAISTLKKKKETMRGQDIKYWARYRLAKELDRLARDQLEEALAADGELPISADEVSTSPDKRRDNKASSHAAKTRRKARFAALAERCYHVDDSENLSLEPVASIADKPIRKGKAKMKARKLPRIADIVDEPFDAIDMDKELMTGHSSSGSASPVETNVDKPKGKGGKNCVVM